MADRRAGRTEANVQSDLHTLLTAAPLDLGANDLDEIVLESPAGQRRRIDVEVGFTVFEVKRDLRVGNIRHEAVVQLAGYVQNRTHDLQQRYVGVLTDGAEWHLYHLIRGELTHISAHTVDPTAPDVDALCVWLEGVLGTAEKITPTPLEIERRLGSTSPSHALDFAQLADLYRTHKNNPGVVLKRQLWAQLLTTALGDNFTADDDLFVEHTLLVATAEIIGHAVIGFHPDDTTISPATLLNGALFTDAQISGVVEADFFDWPAEVDGGGSWVRTIARRLTRFSWNDVEHDVMKVLYESIINAETRHQLGEYYTPDWLAEAIVAEVVTDPLNQTVLDPSCGSGTFLFHAVRHYLVAATAAGVSTADAITGATRSVTGMDVHPVAVTFARVTYLLALGRDRLVSDDRPAFGVPVYLGDSVQWGQNDTFLSIADTLTVSTGEGLTLYAGELNFPHRVMDDAGRFDQLVSELAKKAVDRVKNTPPPPLDSVFRRHAVHLDDRAALSLTFKHMCELQDHGRNHIWGYYVRNLARPAWLARPANRVDVLVGNPPWLSYRFMPPAMKADFRALSESYDMWAGASVATNQDLSGLFIARAMGLYLRMGGSFGFVVPLAALSRKQFAGFRTGNWGSGLRAQFDEPWNLDAVKPAFFPVPGAVVFGTKSDTHKALPSSGPVWSGRLQGRNPSLAEAVDHLTQAAGVAVNQGSPVSLWADRFSEGAAIGPRVLMMIEDGPANPLGSGAGRKAVRSQRSTQEKGKWKQLPSLTGSIELQFLRPVHLGESILPHRVATPARAVIPWDGTQMLAVDHERLDDYPGLASWTRAASDAWMANRTSNTLTLADSVDYRGKLTGQLPTAPHRVAYTKSGAYLTAAHLTDNAVVNDALYWAAVSSADEARFLTAILNSNALLDVVAPLQARGGWGPRHFDKYVFHAPIPLYDPNNEIHKNLVHLAEDAEVLAAAVPLPSGKAFPTYRRLIREALAADTVGQQIEAAVTALL